MKINKDVVMALSFGALNLADYLTTRRILNTGGEELNPVADFFIRKKCLGAVKTVTTLGGMLGLYAEETPKTVGMASIVVYGAIVAHNIKEIVQHEIEIRRESGYLEEDNIE